MRKTPDLKVAWACLGCLLGTLALAAAPSKPPVALRFADGRPVADARVLLLKERDGGPETSGEARTDAAGRFAVGTADAGIVLLLGTSAWPPLLWEVDGTAPAVRVAGIWRVRVVAVEGGKPIEGAEVVAVSRGVTQGLTGLWPGTSATTDRSGEVRVPFASASDLVLVRARGYATATRERGGTVALERASSLEGRFLDPHGRELAGRLVQASVPSPGGASPVIGRARTDARGVYRFEDVPEVVRIVFDGDSAAPCVAERRGAGVRLDLSAHDPVQVRARFVDPQGRPVSGVTMSVEQFTPTESLTVARDARSGSDGVAICAPLSPTIERTRIVVRTAWKGFDSKVFTEPLGATKNLGDWKLGPSAAATGTVVDGTGRPVGKATLTCPRTGEALASTDADGKFSATLMDGQSVFVTVSAKGIVEQETWIRAGTPTKVVVRRACVVKAKPRLPDGATPQEAILVATLEPGWDSLAPMKARADGTFVLEDEAFSGQLSLRVHGYEDAALGFVALSDGDSRDFGVVDLHEGPSIRGALVDAETGEPLAGATATAQPVRDGDLLDVHRDARLPSATTGPDGVFRLGGLPEGDVRLWVEAPGRAVARFDVEALPEGTDLGRVAVARGEPLDVLVEYPDGTPAPGIAVVVRPGGFDGYLRERTFTTDGEGHFVVPRIAPGRHALRATAGTRYVRKLVTIENERTLTFRLSGARVEGRVTVDGEPFPGVRVTLWYGGPGLGTVTEAPKTRDGIPLERRVVGEPPLAPPTNADAAGQFVFAEAGEGPASLRIEGSGWGAESRPIEVPASGRLRVDIALGAVELTVRLVDEAGVPVAPGQLGVFGDGGFRLASTSVDGEGRALFYLEGTGRARYLRGTDNGKRKGFRLLSPKDLAGENAVDLVLGEGSATLTVEAIDGERRPSPSASLHLVNLSDRTVVAGRCDDEGTWRRLNLAEGRYRVIGRGREGGAGEVEVVVPDRGEARTAVRMEEAGKLVLRIEAPPEVDPSTVRVRVLDARGRDRAAEEEALGRSAAPNDRGRYTLPALPPGRYRVELSGKGVTAASLPAEIEASRTTTRAIRLR